MEHRTGFGYLVAAMAVVGIGWAASAQLGPLDPPAGPIADTSPSLAELEVKIDALSGVGATSGPWETLLIAPGAIVNQLQAQHVATGPVFIHKILVTDGMAVVFDGPLGEINSRGIPLTGTPVSRAYATTAGETGYVNATVELTYNVVTDGDFYLAYRTTGLAGSVQVLYTPFSP